jgi:hypothetical protein
MTSDLAEIDRLYKSARLPRRRGRPAWRATDGLFHPGQVAVRRAAFFVELIRSADKGSHNGRHERSVEQAFEYLRKKGFRLPNRESLENFLRRSKRKTKAAN